MVIFPVCVLVVKEKKYWLNKIGPKGVIYQLFCSFCHFQSRIQMKSKNCLKSFSGAFLKFCGMCRLWTAIRINSKNWNPSFQAYALLKKISLRNCKNINIRFDPFFGPSTESARWDFILEVDGRGGEVGEGLFRLWKCQNFYLLI